MKIVIMGCGRVGARLASLMDEEGHDVTVLDNDTYSFRRLPSSFGGTALFGNGIDHHFDLPEHDLVRPGPLQYDTLDSLLVKASHGTRVVKIWHGGWRRILPFWHRKKG